MTNLDRAAAAKRDVLCDFVAAKNKRCSKNSTASGQPVVSDHDPICHVADAVVAPKREKA